MRFTSLPALGEQLYRLTWYRTYDGMKFRGYHLR